MTFLLSILGSRWLPYALAAIAGMALVITIYMAGVHAERDRNKIADLQEQTRILQADIARKKKAAEEDAAQAEADAKTIEELDAKNKELINEISKPDDQCFTDGDTDSLRKHW